MVGAAEAQLAQAELEAQAMTASVRRASAALRTAQMKLQRAAAMQQQAEATHRTEAIITDYTQVTAPVSGVITERLVSPGTLVMPGTVLFKLRTIDRMRLQASVAEADVPGIRVGNPVTVIISGNTNYLLRAPVTSIFRAADPRTRTVTVEAIVNNHAGKLLPGQYVVMEIARGTLRPAITVPLSAIRRDGDGKPYVWVVTEAQPKGKTIYTCVMHPEVQSDKLGKCPKCGMDLVPKQRGGRFTARRVKVVLGETSGRRVEVRAGLREGDEVVTRGNEYLKEGDAVTPVEWGITGPKRLPQPSDAMPSMPRMEHDTHSQRAPTSNHQEPHTSKTTYTCPIHPEVRSDKPGDCPECGMRLEKDGGGHSH